MSSTLFPSSVVRPLKIYFDLAGQEPGHRREWERRLASLAPVDKGDACLVDRPPDADCTVLAAATSYTGRQLGRHWWRAADHQNHLFTWDYGDLPTGRLPGFYCSLPRSSFDLRRHRSFCYPIVYNEQVRPYDRGDAQYRYGFMGGITSGLRARLVRALQSDPDLLLRVQGGGWNEMFDRSGQPSKREYAQSLRLCRFVLCPRGNGVGSVRLFEVMQSARVPVIISDALVLPAGIDWPNCSVSVRERDLKSIPRLLAERESDWARMAENARRAWEDHFDDRHLLPEIAGHLRALLVTTGRAETAQRIAYHRSLLAQSAGRRARAWLGRLQSLLR